MSDMHNAMVIDGDKQYDAFLSYSSADRRSVARIQSFLQAYSYGNPKHRVSVFRDFSDFSSGELSQLIENALKASRFLIVVSSPTAAESRWVEKEIQTFDKIHQDTSRIGVAVLDGKLDVEAIDALKGREYLRHDLTKGWLLGIPRIRTRIEMLRILATLTGQPMRSLVRWHFWQTLRNWSLAILIALIPSVLFMLQPVAIWERIEPKGDHGPVYAVFAEVDSNELRVAYRFRGQGPQGFRNIFAVLQDAAQQDSPSSIEDRFTTKRRLLPVKVTELRIQEWFGEPMDFNPVTDRPPVGEPFIGSPDGKVLVIVQPLGLTEDEEMAAQDNAIDFSVSVPRSNGSVIVVGSGSDVKYSVVDDLNPFWNERDAAGNPTSPSMGLSIVWDDELGIWIGAPGWDGQLPGGLWHSTDFGKSWQRVDGFNSVNSIGIRTVGGVKSVVVSELHFDNWDGILLVPYPSRVVSSSGDTDRWIQAEAPPYGSRSEVEFAGTLEPNQDVFRVDEKLFRRISIPRWETLLRTDIE